MQSLQVRRGPRSVHIPCDYVIKGNKQKEKKNRMMLKNDKDSLYLSSAIHGIQNDELL